MRDANCSHAFEEPDDFCAPSQIDVRPGQSESALTYKAAGCQADRIAAFRLVYKAYLAAGLIEPNRHEMRLTSYHLLPTTDVFLACEGRVPVGTISLVRDGQLGLPCESLFPAEIRRRRQRSAQLGEASSLALGTTNLQRKQVLLGLMRLLAQVARLRGCDEIMASVHPRHASFYQRFVGFEIFGSTVPHWQLRRRPAQGLALSFARIERLRPPAYDLFFASPITAPLLACHPISNAEQAFFQNAAQTDRLSRFAGVDSSILRPAA